MKCMVIIVTDSEQHAPIMDVRVTTLESFDWELANVHSEQENADVDIWQYECDVDDGKPAHLRPLH